MLTIAMRMRSFDHLCVMLVDDDANLVAGLRRSFASSCPHWSITTATSIREACDRLRDGAGGMDVIVADVQMPEATGDMLLRSIQVSFPHIIRILLSGELTICDLRRHQRVAERMLTKPCPAELIVEEIRSAYAERVGAAGSSRET